MFKIKTICIVNDDEIFTFILKKSIVKLNICEQVLTYTNGEEAINVLSKECVVLPEIILLDINMPFMNGWEFLEEFSKINKSKKIAIYLISAHISPEDNLKAKNNYEITGILSDPADSETITRIVNEY